MDRSSGMIIEGYACVFEYPYFLRRVREGQDIIQEWEVIDQGAFKYCDMTKTELLFNHAGDPCASVQAGTLAIDIDWYGLHYVADLAATESGRRLFDDLIEYADIKYSSMKFCANKKADEYTYSLDTSTAEKKKLCRVKEVLLLKDVSPVDTPANDRTCVFSARNIFGLRVQLEMKKEKKREQMRRAIRAMMDP